MLSPERVQDVAYLLAALVDRLRQADYGMSAVAIEMSNEPNGHWSTYIAPAVWAKLACATRDALDAKGLQHVLISGPGTSMGSDKPYLAALAAANGSRCIGILSTHSWESTTSKAGPHELAGMLRKYDAVRRQFDPQHEKIWIATETGARTNYIAGHLFQHNAVRFASRCVHPASHERPVRPRAVLAGLGPGLESRLLRPSDSEWHSVGGDGRALCAVHWCIRSVQADHAGAHVGRRRHGASGGSQRKRDEPDSLGRAYAW